MENTPMIGVIKCGACGTLDPGPRELCPHCFSAGMVNVDVPGQGVLVSWTVVRRPAQALARHGPYAVAAVTLDAGVQITGRLARIDEPLEPGARVQAVGCLEGYNIFEGAF